MQITSSGLGVAVEILLEATRRLIAGYNERAGIREAVRSVQVLDGEGCANQIVLVGLLALDGGTVGDALLDDVLRGFLELHDGRRARVVAVAGELGLDVDGLGCWSPTDLEADDD